VGLIYKMMCMNCESDVEFSGKLDGDGDLMVFVQPCEKCMDNVEKEYDETISELQHEVNQVKAELKKVKRERDKSTENGRSERKDES
jgi:hypothetical protein